MPRLIAAIAHMLTASGVIWAFFALQAAMASRWETLFLWLGVALIVDGIDGPIARASKADQVLPRFSGERLDMIVDYVTYVFIPAFAIARSGLMPDGTGGVTAAIILLTSLFHFADLESKTTDYYFRGFPAIWNIVAFYIFAIQAPPLLALIAVLAFAALTFAPFTWVHPMRVSVLRLLTVAVAALGGAAAALAIAQGFPASVPVQLVLGACAIYLIGVGLIRGGRGAPDPERD